MSPVVGFYPPPAVDCFPTGNVPVKKENPYDQRTLAALRQSRIASAKAVLLFRPETRYRENDLSVRSFAEYYGVPEEPTTGSANGCLAGYLVKHRYFGQDRINVRVEQGYEIGRPSRLFLEAEGQADTIAVRVGGQVIMSARGELL